MRDLVADTCAKMEAWLMQCHRPAVMWSGGKDSTAMLHLLLFKVGVKLPVIQWREPRLRTRYAHSDRLAAEWDLEMYDWAPYGFAIQDGYDIETGEPRLDFVKGYEMAPHKLMLLFLGTETPEPGGPYVCGLEALQRPTGRFNFPWGGVFHGQKSADVDLIKGQVPLAQDVVRPDGAPLQFFPMRHWSDADIWNYLESEGVPNDETRYQKADGVWQHKKDKANNADYYPVCWNCVNRHLADTVYCPKLKCQTNNISQQATYIDFESETQGFRPAWQSSTVNNVAHAAAISGAGQSYDETDLTPRESLNGCCAMTTH